MGTVLYILFSLIILALFEFNKNTLAGWAVAIVLLILYPIVRLRKPFKNKKLLRIPLFLLLCAALGAALKFTEGPVKLRDAVEGNNGGVTEIVEVAQGQLTGVYTEDKQVEVYTGIPYAAPPVGDLRWKEPADPESWEGVRACDKFAPMSMQVQSNTIYSSLSRMIGYHDYKISLKDNFKDANSEDALYLNIW
ncbi:MAG: carboxylesterase family protein, partial [Oscillospiraceae bacterium]|nr:carboxylesterase family protein [Oscillospiraceae bacterium]